MWRVIGKSVPGMSHIAEGIACQDSCCYGTFRDGDKACSVACISDGAGSAPRGGEGSREAVRCAFEFATSHAALLRDDFRRFFVELFEAVLAHLRQIADQADTCLQDYACTLVIGFLVQRQGYFAQIGDGALVVEIQDEGFECKTWPSQGEFANETVFLTSKEALDRVQIIREDRIITFYAAFTDGIQRLALHYASNSAHAPFFLHLKDGLAQADHSDDALISFLGDFLKSEALNVRTDDDKTLVMGVWTDDESQGSS